DSGAFPVEPQIKEETISHVGAKRPYPLVERRNHAVKARDEEGAWSTLDIDLLGSETVLGRLEDPSRYPELDAIRRTLLQWRFYHSLRTDTSSPMRRTRGRRPWPRTAPTSPRCSRPCRTSSATP